MGLLDTILSTIDAKKRSAKRGIMDMLDNPQQWAGMQANRIQEDRYGGAENAQAMKQYLSKQPYDPKALAAANDALRNAAINESLGAVTAWHGSPHKFDKFDMSKIGSGEGAQAYGHGLYMAEKPGVANSYRENLAGGNNSLPDWFQSNDMVEARNAAIKAGFSGADLEAAMLLKNAAHGVSIHNVNASTRKSLIDAAMRYEPEVYGTNLDSLQRVANKIYPEEAGALYKVDIPDEAVARFLDWDKPLSQQAPEVQKMLGELATANQAHINGTPLRQFIYDNAKQSGSLPSVVIREIEKAGSLDSALPALERKFSNANVAAKDKYNELINLLRQQNISMNVMPDSVRTGGDIVRSGYNPPEIAEMLKAKGIPGIRYLDGGSRSAGQGSSNYVLFDDQLPRILERNGQPTGLQPWAKGEWKGLLSEGNGY